MIEPLKLQSWITVGIVAVILVSLSSLWKPKPATEAQTRAAHEQAWAANRISFAQAQIAARLKDPGSAVFRGSYVSPKNAVCGEVNARNGFGGYMGYQRFIVQGAEAFTADDFHGQIDDVWPKYC